MTSHKIFDELLEMAYANGIGPVFWLVSPNFRSARATLRRFFGWRRIPRHITLKRVEQDLFEVRIKKT